MSKVFLVVVIIYSNQPSKTYHYSNKSPTECYEQAAMLGTQSAPQADNVVKYMIGCSFEEPVESEPT